jgi:tRNA(Ile2) C34 agmatinyltransferase TiaS
MKMVDTDTYDLLQMINRNNNYVSDTIQYTNDLINDIRYNNKELADKLESDKDSLADRTQSCPDCGEKLIAIGTWKEYRGEYCGVDSYETMYKYGCDCGYIRE